MDNKITVTVKVTTPQGGTIFHRVAWAKRSGDRTEQAKDLAARASMSANSYAEKVEGAMSANQGAASANRCAVDKQ